jgi:hypothetical protein
MHKCCWKIEHHCLHQSTICQITGSNEGMTMTISSIFFISMFQLLLKHFSITRGKYTTKTGYMSPYYLSKAYITNLSYCNTMGPYYRHGMCFRASSVFVLSILFWFPQLTHYFWRVFRFLFMEHKQDYSVTSVKDVFCLQVQSVTPWQLHDRKRRMT